MDDSCEWSVCERCGLESLTGEEAVESGLCAKGVNLRWSLFLPLGEPGLGPMIGAPAMDGLGCGGLWGGERDRKQETARCEMWMRGLVVCSSGFDPTFIATDAGTKLSKVQCRVFTAFPVEEF